MTSKEKAEKLVNKFYKYAHDGSNSSYYDTKIWTNNAKQCALISVDEIRNNIPLISDIQQYWIDVKKEIELL